MRLRLPDRQQQRIERVLEIAVIAAAVATIPLTYAHMQEWDGVYLAFSGWLLWVIFAVEYIYAQAVSEDRWRTTKSKWLNLVIVIVSFPPLPHLLGLARLIRLVRPLRLLGGLGISRPLVLLRLYVIRSEGGRRIFGKAKESGHIDAARSRLDDAKERLGSQVPGAGDERN
ncbi:MAG: hypothetical protein WD333_13095 [Dehalococcoidia bacterium]